ncbi:MAG TPA: SIMPL domain-containing protein [Solirubrobacteraceae bacterium]
MKSVIAGTMVVTVGLLAANMLGVAIAETTPTPALRTVSVQGIGTAPVGQHDSAEAATAVYRQAMTNAVTDGQSKASFLASKTGATLGAVQSIAEGGGYINCSGGEAEYAEYEGGQPDFGSGPQPVGITAPTAAAPSVRRVKVRRPKSKHTVAKKATAASCTLSAQVSLLYTLN